MARVVSAPCHWVSSMLTFLHHDLQIAEPTILRPFQRRHITTVTHAKIRLGEYRQFTAGGVRVSEAFQVIAILAREQSIQRLSTNSMSKHSYCSSFPQSQDDL